MANNGLNEALSAERAEVEAMADNTNAIYGGAASRIKFTNARNSSESVSFKAFLTAFSDSYTANWNETTVYARMDPIYTFQNTTRVLSFGIGIPAYDAHEASSNLLKISKLVRMLYPSYAGKDKGSTMQNSPVIAIKFGNLITDASGNSKIGLYGVLSGVNVEPDTEAGFFTSHNEKTGINIAPKVLNLSCEFKPLHAHIVGHTDDDTFQEFPYLSEEIKALPINNTAQGAIDADGQRDIIDALATDLLGGN